MKLVDVSRVQEILREWKAGEKVPLAEEVQMEICGVIQTPVVHGNPGIVELLGIFSNFEENAAQLMAVSPRLLGEVISLFLRHATFHSAQLLYYARQALTLIDRAAAGAPTKKKEGWVAQVMIGTSVAEADGFREVEQAALEALGQALGLGHRFTGKLGTLYAGQSRAVPVLVCELTERQGVPVGENHLDRVEETANYSDRYFLFPKEARVRYELTDEEVEYFYLLAKHYLLVSTLTREKAGCLARLVLGVGPHPEALLVYAQTLTESPMRQLMALEHPECTPRHAGDEREYELLLAQAQAAVGGHAYAQGIFKKYHQIEQLIALGGFASDRSEIVPLLETKIGEIREKIQVAELENAMDAYLSLGTPSRVAAPQAFLNIELGTYLHSLGKLTRQLAPLREAFQVLKIPSHGKTLGAQLLFEGHAEEAVAVLQECSFSVLNADDTNLLALSLFQAERPAEAEKLLRQVKVFHPTNTKIDTTLQLVLVAQGKLEASIELIAARSKTYSPDIVSDCSALFEYGRTAERFDYCREALVQLYRRQTQIAPEWVSTLLAAAKTNASAKTALLSALSAMDTLGVTGHLRDTLALPGEVPPEVEYFARKRIMEDAIKQRNYSEGEQTLGLMRGLAARANLQEDFIGVFSGFYSALNQ